MPLSSRACDFFVRCNVAYLLSVLRFSPSPCLDIDFSESNSCEFVRTRVNSRLVFSVPSVSPCLLGEFWLRLCPSQFKAFAVVLANCQLLSADCFFPQFPTSPSPTYQFTHLPNQQCGLHRNGVISGNAL